MRFFGLINSIYSNRCNEENVLDLSLKRIPWNKMVIITVLA